MALNPKYQTKVQHLKRVREKYRSSQGLDSCRFAYILLKYLSDGDCTLAQMQSAWNMSAPEWTVKASSLQVKANKYQAYLDSTNNTKNDTGA